MSAFYDLFENPPAPNAEEQLSLHARIVSKGTVDKEEFLDRVHKFTGISRGLLSGAMEAFANEARDLLADGWSVEIGDLGFLSTSLQCPSVSDKKEIRANSVKLKSINFRASRYFKKEVGHNMRLKRDESSTQSQKSSISREVCILRLNKHLENHPFISRTQYCRLTGRNRNRAIEELNAFVEENKIQRYGAGKLTVYIKGE